MFINIFNSSGDNFCKVIYFNFNDYFKTLPQYSAPADSVNFLKKIRFNQNNQKFTNNPINSDMFIDIFYSSWDNLCKVIYFNSNDYFKTLPQYFVADCIIIPTP